MMIAEGLGRETEARKFRHPIYKLGIIIYKIYFRMFTMNFAGKANKKTRTTDALSEAFIQFTHLFICIYFSSRSP